MSEEKKTIESKDNELEKVSGGVDGSCPKSLRRANDFECADCPNKYKVTDCTTYSIYQCPYVSGLITKENERNHGPLHPLF